MFYLIVNTQAGESKYKSLAKKIERRARDLSLDIKIAPTDNLLEAKKLAKAAAGKSNVRAVVAVGGNKTVNTLIGALAGSSKPLGIVPLTRGSGLAKSLGIKNWQDGLKVLKEHEIEERAVGQINKNFFLGELRLLPKKQLVAEAKKITQSLFNRFLKRIKLPTESFVPITIKTGSNLSMELEGSQIKIVLQSTPKPSLNITIKSKPSTEHEDEFYKMTPREIAGLTTTILNDKKIKIDSRLPLPAISYGEKVGVTPAEITASSKKLKIMIPKEPKERTRAPK